MLPLFAVAAQGAVVSQSWSAGKLSLVLDDGRAALEWISPTAFRFSRTWGSASASPQVVRHDPVLVAKEDLSRGFRMRSNYLALELDESALRVQVQAEGKVLLTTSLRQAGDIVNLDIDPAPKLFGGRSGFFFSLEGYGLYRLPVGDRRAADFVLYYGPSPKEILEQHHAVKATKEVAAQSLRVLRADEVPAEAVAIPSAILVWDGLTSLIRSLIEASLSGELYPAVNAALFEHAPAEIRERAFDLAAVLPLVAGGGRGGVDRSTRSALTPYLTTYLREAYDRGFPVIRPFPIEFPNDAGADRHPYEFMLGDEFLVAPVVESANRRRLRLPRGVWTDLRTNIEYRGNQEIEIEAPQGRVPMFARNGSLFPLATGNRMELHYIPSLGGEFFLWEPTLSSNSQFHAAPAGDFLRVEVETKVERTYEWVLHHTRAPSEVAEESGAYARVNSRSALRAGTWWHDAALNNLHLMLRAAAGSDRIVNIAFP